MTGFPDDRPGGPANGPADRPSDGPGSVTGGGRGDAGGTGGTGGADGLNGLGPVDSGESADPLEPLLGPPAAFLHAPPGSFERIRRRAARRRRTRAALGATAAVAVIAGTVYLTGSLRTGDDEMVGPPASSPLTGAASTTQGGTPTAAPSPAATVTGSPDPRQTQASPTPTSAGQSAGGAPTPTTSGTTPSSTPVCTTAQLSAALGGGDAGAGNLYRYLVLTNTGTTTCHLTGFPGVSMLDANGRQIGQPATRTQDGYAAVELAPGGSASDTIHTVNQQGTCLPASTQLRVYPPGSKASLVIPGQITDCFDTFTVTPLTSGKTGNPPS